MLHGTDGRTRIKSMLACYQNFLLYISNYSLTLIIVLKAVLDKNGSPEWHTRIKYNSFCGKHY